MLKNIARSLVGSSNLRKYLAQCRVRTAGEEGVTVPPSSDEVQELLAYLKDFGVTGVIVGSAAILKHLGDQGELDVSKDFRPTSDLDIFINRSLPKNPPPGWSVDKEAIGVPSWISPTGGYVDFLQAGMEFPGGRKNPSKIGIDESVSDLPVADVPSIFRLKLNSERNKDLMDIIALARKTGVPKDLGKLNQQQKENLQMVEQWLKYKPSGNYGE